MECCRRDLAFGSVKTRFKAILKSWIFRSRSTFRPRFTFSWTFAPGGRLSYEAYNVFTFTLHLHLYLLIYIYIYITFLIYIYITLHLHLHYIYIYIIIFMYFLQNVIWLNTRTGLRYKRHICMCRNMMNSYVSSVSAGF